MNVLKTFIRRANKKTLLFFLCFYSIAVFSVNADTVTIPADSTSATFDITIINDWEDFESGGNNWIIDNGIWEIGVPTNGPGSAHSASNCAATVLGGKYPGGYSARLISPQIDLSEAGKVEKILLRYWQYYSYYSGDYGEIHVQTYDNNQWSEWLPLSLTRVTGYQSNWEIAEAKLTEYSGKLVRISFFHYNDNSNKDNVSTGWYIDDVIIAQKAIADETRDLQDGFNVDLVWTANSEPNIAGYNIYRDGATINTELIDVTYYSDMVMSEKRYVYNATAVNQHGQESLFSNSVSISVERIVPTITEPVERTLLVDSEITVRGIAAMGAIVEIFVNGVSQGTTVATSTGYFSLSGVQVLEGESSIRAISTNSYGSTSPASTAVTVPVDPRPQTPGGLAGSPGDTVLTLTWGSNAESDIRGYNVYRDGTMLNAGILTETTFVDGCLTNGKGYNYTVTAVDNYGSESHQSNAIIVAPVAGTGW